MNAVAKRAGRLAMVGALVGMVASLTAPHAGLVSAGPSDTVPIETTVPADPGPETTVVETEPIPTTEVDATTPVSTVVDNPPESTVVDTAPESTVPETTATDTTVPDTTVPDTTAPDTTVPAPTRDDDGPEGVIGLAAPGDVTVEAVCDSGFRPAIHITNLSTGNVLVSVGHNAFSLTPSEEVHLDWPTIEGDPPTLDPAPKWDAVDLDAIPPVVFDEGILSLPAGCPPTDVPSAPLNMASAAGDASVALSWTEPDLNGGSDITDYTIEHNIQGDGDESWTTFDDGIGTGTTANVVGLTNGETYRFRIRAVNGTGAGVSVEAKDSPNVLAAAPTGITVAPTGRGGLLVSWTTPSTGTPFSAYIIQRSLDGASFSDVTEVPGEATSFLDTGLTRPQQYHYQVAAINSRGQGTWSSVASGVPNDISTAPRSLTAAATNLSGQVRLSWLPPAFDGGSPIRDYVVQQSPNGTSQWRTIVDGVNVNTSYTVSGLTNGVRYYFRIVAKNFVPGFSPPSNVANAIPLAVPTTPRSLTAAATGVSGRIQLSWLPPISNGASVVTNYVIQRSPNGSTDWTTVPDGVNVNTSYTVTGLSNGVRYHFRVSATNAVGRGPTSNVASAIPSVFLTAPRTLSATPTNRSGELRLAWLAPLSNGGSAITNYIIQRSPNGSTGWTTVPDGVNVNTSFTVTGLTNGVQYYFRVAATTAVSRGPTSNLARGIPRVVATAPRSTRAAPTNRSGQVRLTWVMPASNGGGAITDYLIQRSPNGTTGWATITDGTSTATTFTVTGLTNGVRYHFRVLARNAAGLSPASPVASAIPRTVPSAPPFVRVAAFEWGFVLDWGDPLSTGGSPITGFLIQTYDYNSDTWVDFHTARPTTRVLTISAPGEGCGAFRIATLNAAGRSPFRGPVEDCWP